VTQKHSRTRIAMAGETKVRESRGGNRQQLTATAFVMEGSGRGGRDGGD